MRIHTAAALAAIALLSACVSPKKYSELQSSYDSSVQRAEALKIEAERARINGEVADGHQLSEHVNPLLGLPIVVHVEHDQLHYHGVRFVLKLGPLLLPIPEWLALGHTSIVETGAADNHFAMDFRLTHPLFGQIFRYAGVLQNRPV